MDKSRTESAKELSRKLREYQNRKRWEREYAERAYDAIQRMSGERYSAGSVGQYVGLAW
jgi:hypothetical protein